MFEILDVLLNNKKYERTKKKIHQRKRFETREPRKIKNLTVHLEKHQTNDRILSVGCSLLWLAFVRFVYRKKGHLKDDEKYNK